MSNLLPRATQNQVWADTVARFVATASTMFISAAGISLATLIPAYVVLAVRTPGGAVHASSTSSSTASVADIAAVQEIMKGIAPVLQSTSSPETEIASVLAARNEDVDISHITYTQGKPSVIMLVGAAETRDFLNDYRVALIKAHVGAVSVPVSALIGSQDGQFTMTVTGNF